MGSNDNNDGRTGNHQFNSTVAIVLNSEWWENPQSITLMQYSRESIDACKEMWQPVLRHCTTMN